MGQLQVQLDWKLREEHPRGHELWAVSMPSRAMALVTGCRRRNSLHRGYQQYTEILRPNLVRSNVGTGQCGPWANLCPPVERTTTAKRRWLTGLPLRGIG